MELTKLEKPRYMMATKAIHQLGDISRKKPDLCVVHSEDGNNYIGNWVTGLGYINVKFPKKTTRELTDKEKDKWDGRRITLGNSPAFVIRVKEREVVETKESPVIVLPNDEMRKRQLEDKLKEYKGRKDPHRHPALQMDTICKIEVLERLLRDGKVVTWDLSREMAKTYGDSLDVDALDNACFVIEDYCKTGGKSIDGGTGLRTPEQMASKQLRPGYPPMGKQVRLTQDLQCSDRLGIQPGDKFRIGKKGNAKIERVGPRLPAPVIPAGSIGVVATGAYSSGCYKYEEECPVQFGLKNPMIPETIGVKWELLELVE